MNKIIITQDAAMELWNESRGIASLLEAALCAYDCDYDSKPNAVINLVDSITGILLLAKAHDAKITKINDDILMGNAITI